MLLSTSVEIRQSKIASWPTIRRSRICVFTQPPPIAEIQTGTHFPPSVVSLIHVHFLTGRENGWPVNQGLACEASSILKGAPARPAMLRSLHSAAPSKRPASSSSTAISPASGCESLREDRSRSKSSMQRMMIRWRSGPGAV
jgi:hypothetical protein